MVVARINDKQFYSCSTDQCWDDIVKLKLFDYWRLVLNGNRGFPVEKDEYSVFPAVVRIRQQHANRGQSTNIMKKTLVPILIIVSLLLGCESTQHYNRTKVVTLGTPLPKRPYGSVKLYQAKEEVSGNYDVIAMMSVEGKAGEEAQFIKAFLYRAADLGAEGLILYRVSFAAGTEGGGWILGKNGGFGLPSKTSQDAVFRGEAIHFK